MPSTTPRNAASKHVVRSLDACLAIEPDSPKFTPWEIVYPGHAPFYTWAVCKGVAFNLIAKKGMKAKVIKEPIDTSDVRTGSNKAARGPFSTKAAARLAAPRNPLWSLFRVEFPGHKPYWSWGQYHDNVLTDVSEKILHAKVTRLDPSVRKVEVQGSAARVTEINGYDPCSDLFGDTAREAWERQVIQITTAQF